MLDFEIKPRGPLFRTVLEFAFEAKAHAAIQCAASSAEKILYSITVKNHGWGVRGCNLELRYRSEPEKNIFLCPDKHSDDCRKVSGELIQQLPSGRPGELVQNIFSLPQRYFKGPERQIQIRACVVRPDETDDFDVTCEIKGNLESRDDDGNTPSPVLLVLNLHVRITD